MHADTKIYVPLLETEPDPRPAPPSDIAEWETLVAFRRLLAKTHRPHADLARRVWELYEADNECRLPREYIALFQRKLGVSAYKLRLARQLIGELLQKAGVL